MEAHDALILSNAAAEAVDSTRKEPLSVPKRKPMAQRKGFRCNPKTMAALDAGERALMRRYGAWMSSLADGSLAPTTPAQARFVAAANGQVKAESPYE